MAVLLHNMLSSIPEDLLLVLYSLNFHYSCDIKNSFSKYDQTRDTSSSNVNASCFWNVLIRLLHPFPGQSDILQIFSGDVLPGFPTSSLRTSCHVDKVPVNSLLYCSAFLHSYDMSKPSQYSFFSVLVLWVLFFSRHLRCSLCHALPSQ